MLGFKGLGFKAPVELQKGVHLQLPVRLPEVDPPPGDEDKSLDSHARREHTLELVNVWWKKSKG
jgi:hypothetical protein